jgi:hypothetical protein
VKKRSIGVLECWSAETADGLLKTPPLHYLNLIMATSYRNKNRGYQQLRVWQDVAYGGGA